MTFLSEETDFGNLNYLRTFDVSYKFVNEVNCATKNVATVYGRISNQSSSNQILKIAVMKVA